MWQTHSFYQCFCSARQVNASSSGANEAPLDRQSYTLMISQAYRFRFRTTGSVRDLQRWARGGLQLSQTPANDLQTLMTSFERCLVSVILHFQAQEPIQLPSVMRSPLNGQTPSTLSRSTAQYVAMSPNSMRESRSVAWAAF